MDIGSIVLSIYIERFGIADPAIHPLMTASPVKPLRRWNTGHIWFTLNGNVEQQWTMPNWINNDEVLRLNWSPRWMRSSICYQGSDLASLAFPHFTWVMDGEQHTDEYRFFDGIVVWKYAGRWEKI